MMTHGETTWSDHFDVLSREGNLSHTEMKFFPVLPEFWCVFFWTTCFQRFRFCDQSNSEERIFGGCRGVSNIGILHTKLKSF